MTSALLQIPVNRIDGTATTLAPYSGSVLLIVNVASACGLTPQYSALEAVYEKYRDRGLVVLGFPCNDFMGQEPGSAEEIREFCETKFGVQFPLFEKITINAAPRHPLYRSLIEARPKAEIKPQSELRSKLESHGIAPKNESDVLWNFEKFLVARNGEVVGRFAPDMAPDDPALIAAIEAQLGPNE